MLASVLRIFMQGILSLASIIHADWSLAGGICWAAWRILILGSECDGGPAVGPGGRGFHAPRGVLLSLAVGMGFDRVRAARAGR